MDKIIKKVYLCYLGRDLRFRTTKIVCMLEEGNKEFFYIHGTDKDSILDFIKKGEKLELKYFK